jgi:hypothetical protein
MQSRNVFAGPYLERAAHLRSDPAWFENALADPRSRVVPVWNSRSLVADGDTSGVDTSGVDTPGVGTPAAGAPRAAFLNLTQKPHQRRNINHMIFIGHIKSTKYI